MAPELLWEAQGGDMSAFEKLVERHRDSVYGLGLQITRSETCAVEIAQKSFLSAYTHLNEFRTDGEFGVWVRRAAAELTMVVSRGLARVVEDEFNSRVFNQGGGPAEYRPTDWRHSVDEEPLNAELRDAMQRATDQLPQNQREVLLFKDLASLPYEQIAEITGQSIPALKHHLHQARLHLHQAIDGFYSKG
jgi:RNA polymerase sigma-70 factor (ECF subfamily)